VSTQSASRRHRYGPLRGLGASGSTRSTAEVATKASHTRGKGKGKGGSQMVEKAMNLVGDDLFFV